MKIYLQNKTLTASPESRAGSKKAIIGKYSFAPLFSGSFNLNMEGECLRLFLSFDDSPAVAGAFAGRASINSISFELT